MRLTPLLVAVAVVVLRDEAMALVLDLVGELYIVDAKAEPPLRR